VLPPLDFNSCYALDCSTVVGLWQAAARVNYVNGTFGYQFWQPVGLTVHTLVAFGQSAGICKPFVRRVMVLQSHRPPKTKANSLVLFLTVTPTLMEPNPNP